MTLSAQQKQQLTVMKTQFIAAVTKRSINPADFNTNITFLRDMDSILPPFMMLLSPYYEKIGSANMQVSRSGCNIFTLLKAKSDIYSSNKSIKEANEILFHETVKELVKAVYEKEPRIKGINSNINYQSNKTQGLFEQPPAKKYTISFSDGTDIIFHTLDDEKILMDLRVVFENKMQMLPNPDNDRLFNEENLVFQLKN